MKKDKWLAELNRRYRIAFSVGIETGKSIHAFTPEETTIFESALSVVDSVSRIERKLSRLHETESNGILRPVRLSDGRTITEPTWTDKDQERSDREESRLMARAEQLALSVGWSTVVQGDPRGAGLTLTTSDGRDITDILFKR